MSANRKELIAELSNAKRYFEEQDIDFLPGLLQKALDEIESMPDMYWRFPEDELPNDEELVLAWVEHSLMSQTTRMYDLTWQDKGRWGGSGKVLAWARLPEPPEE